MPTEKNNTCSKLGGKERRKRSLMVSMGMRLPCKRHCGIKICRRQDWSPWCLRLTVHSSLLMANIFRDMKGFFGSRWLCICRMSHYPYWCTSHCPIKWCFFSSKLHHWLCFSGILWFTYNSCNFLSYYAKKGLLCFT